jgi:WD40 repeat protein
VASRKRSLTEKAASRIGTLRNSRGPAVWTSDGAALVTASRDGGFLVWDAETRRVVAQSEQRYRCTAFSTHGHFVATLSEHELAISDMRTGRKIAATEPANTEEEITSIAWSPDGKFIATASYSGDVNLWTPAGLDHVAKLTFSADNPDQTDVMLTLTWSTDSTRLAGASYDGWVWDISNLTEPRSVKTQVGLYDVAWSPDAKSRWLVAGSSQRVIEIYDGQSLKQLNLLEGHSGHVRRIAFSGDGEILASYGDEGTIRIWNAGDWRMLNSIAVNAHRSLAFRPHSYEFLVSPSHAHAVQLWALDVGRLRSDYDSSSTISYKSAKVVLVGDSGVGKTGLGWRLAHGAFKEHSSTHGQQFWVLDRVSDTADAVQREAVLWDLAGQPDYRLIHALFLDDADIALLLYDPTHATNPLSGVEYWINQLRLCSTEGGVSDGCGPPSALVAARADRGTARISNEEIAAFCQQKGLRAHFYSSAKSGEGVDDIVTWIANNINWDDKPSTITTTTFKIVKDHVLSLKESRQGGEDIVLSIPELGKLLSREFKGQRFTEGDIATAVANLSNHGYVSIVKTSNGAIRVLLIPELLNNLAASFVLEARRNRKGLGSLTESALLQREYHFPEIQHLSESDQDVLIDSTVTTFLKHNICFRETAPLNKASFIVFPELINLARPDIPDDANITESVSYIVSGSTENVYASLVVLLGYTNTFTRTNQWRNQARYEVGEGLVCGFRLEEEGPGKISFVLYFGENVGESVRNLFKSLFESFLSRHEVLVRRLEPVLCGQGHQLNRVVVREFSEAGEESSFCNRCGSPVTIPDDSSLTPLDLAQAATVRGEALVADQRSRLEQALFRLSTYAGEQRRLGLKCFVSYAWGDPEHERWVERKLATDLTKAGIEVVLDRWHNADVGASVPRFVDLVESANYVVVVGTPGYRKKYDNIDPKRGYVVAAEGDIVGMRMIGTELGKRTVLPVLLAGDEGESFPPLLRARVFSDFRREAQYARELINLIMTIYQIDRRNPLAIEIGDMLQGAFQE